MSKYGGEDREQLVAGTHPVTKEPMVVRRRVGSRSVDTQPVRGDSVVRTGLEAGLGGIAGQEFDVRLAAVTDMLVGVEELPSVGVLIGVDETPSVDQVESVGNRRWSKPRGGLWAAPLVGRRSSAWVEWCRNADYLPNDEPTMRLWEMHPGDATVLRVGTVDEARRVAKDFKLTPANDIEEYDIPALDFELLSEAGVDAIWVSEGVAVNANANMFKEGASPFFGWDCESVLWLRVPPTTRFRDAGVVKL